MGQRTAFLIKRIYWNGKVNVRLVHHQWGIGRVMHNHFMKDFMEIVTDRSYDKSLKDYMKIFDYEGALYVEHNYRKGSASIPDVFDKKVIKRYFNKTDNNNGGMIIEIKENIKVRQREGIDSALARGVKFGRPTKYRKMSFAVMNYTNKV